jgi:protein-S-isoprenylcysteine O-methyltransferase Ste14
MYSKSFKSNFLTTVGWIAIIGFIGIYIAEFFPKHGPPITIKWIEETFGTTGLIIVNIVIVLAFFALLPYRRSTKSDWKSKGTFIAFVIALMTEMFGWPLFIFLLSPLFDIPKIAPDYFRSIGHWPALIGTGISFFGLILIAIGWKRHPQYTGIFLFTFGWILHWPSIITLIIWPVLLLAYYWLSRFEEKMAIEDFGEEYKIYMQHSKRFIPYVF